MRIKDTTEISAARGPSAAAPVEKVQIDTPSLAASDKVSASGAQGVHTLADAARQEASASRAAQKLAVAAAVKQGTYVPDPQQLADRILDDAEITAQLQAIFKR